MATGFIFDTAPFAECHASTVVELRNGAMMSAWFGGSAEGNPDVTIWGACRDLNGWSVPRQLAIEPGVACYNPVLFYTLDGRLWLYYKFGKSPMTWTAGRRFSTDDGENWSRAEHLPAGLYGPVRTKPLVEDDGTIISGTSVETYRAWACWIERSADHGQTWTKAGPITVPEEFTKSGFAGDIPKAVPGSEDWPHTNGIIQPSVVALADRLRLYARSTARTAKVCVADSFDDGITWTTARPIKVPNPNSGLDAVALKDGRVVLIYNHTDSGRSPLNLAVSRDGERFDMFRVLEDQPGEFSYPALIEGEGIEGEGGVLHLTYTWNRENIRYRRIPLVEVPE